MKVQAEKTLVVRDFFEDRKSLLILLGILILSNLVVAFITHYVKPLKVIEFVFLAVFWGLAPAYYFRKVFKFENWIGWLVNSGVLGILTIPFVFLFAGWIGFNFVFVQSVWFIYLCSFLGIITLFIDTDKNTLSECIHGNSIRRVDIVFYMILFGFTVHLTLLNFYQINPKWDAFTFWGLDAKYLFQYNHLRDAALDVFNMFRYTSYYPIYYSIIYHIYGAIVEQYASWINVFINFLAMMLIYNRILHKGLLQKIMIVALLLITAFGAIDAANMFTMYAELISSFSMLVFVLILTGEAELSLETYGKRMLLLLLAALSLYFIKSPNLMLTIALIALWIVYDIKFLAAHWRNLIRRADVVVSSAIFFTLYLMRAFYFATILRIGADTPITDIFFENPFALDTLFAYIKDLTSWFAKQNPYLLGCWLLGFVSIILIIVLKKLSKRYLFIYLVSISIFLFYFSYYILYQYDFPNGSIIRYTSIVMYLIPLMFCMLDIMPPVSNCGFPLNQKSAIYDQEGYIVIVFPKKISYMVIGCLSILSLLFLIRTVSRMPLYQSFKISPGSYDFVMKEYSTFAKKVLDITGVNSKILIADDNHETGMADNRNSPAIYIRYYMMDNSAGGQYVDVPMPTLYSYALENHADYILLLSYDQTLESCGAGLKLAGNYIFKLNQKTSCTGADCICSSLTNAVELPVLK